MEVAEILSEIKTICIRENVDKVLIFGSFAKGTQHKTSDIDIAVKTDEKTFDIIEKKINDINTLRKIDIVNLEQKGLNKNLLEDIKTYGKILYEKV